MRAISEFNFGDGFAAKSTGRWVFRPNELLSPDAEMAMEHTLIVVVDGVKRLHGGCLKWLTPAPWKSAVPTTYELGVRLVAGEGGRSTPSRWYEPSARQ